MDNLEEMMAIKTIRLGSAENVIQYDDGDYDSAIEVEGTIVADNIEAGSMPSATPVDADLLVFKDVSNNDTLSTCTFADLKTYLGL